MHNKLLINEIWFSFCAALDYNPSNIILNNLATHNFSDKWLITDLYSISNLFININKAIS